MSKFHPATLAVLALATLSSPALAHATLEVSEAKIGSAYKAVIRIGHGCEGAPTKTVKVDLPEGFIAAKPMPKAGWALEVISGSYASGYMLYGKKVSEGTKQIIWKGELPDAFYDEFVVRGNLAGELKAGTKLYFPVAQECDKAAHHWVQIPAPGQDAHSLAEPAPFITLAAADVKDNAITAGSLKISGAFARATPQGAKVGGAYVSILNSGTEADRLVSFRTEQAGRSEVHEMKMDNGIMTMRALDQGLVIAPGARVDLKPGGNHLMLMDLKQPLSQGAILKGTLVFEKAGEVPVTFSVEGIGAQGASQPGGHAGHDGH